MYEIGGSDLALKSAIPALAECCDTRAIVCPHIGKAVHVGGSYKLEASATLVVVVCRRDIGTCTVN